MFLYDRAVKISEITDGTSHTLALAEDTGRGWLMDGEWINGENIYDVSNLINTQQHNEIWSDHPGGAMALWCDGSARSWRSDGPTGAAIDLHAGGNDVDEWYVMTGIRPNMSHAKALRRKGSMLKFVRLLCLRAFA